VQPYIVNETDGTWARRSWYRVAGSGVLDKGGNAEVESMSCASAGNCSAGGSYELRSGQREEVFTVDEIDGTWADAQEIPGSAALNKGGGDQIAAVSRGSAGNCGAVGFYTDSSQNYQAFSVSETNGTWGRAAEIPGTAGLNTANAAAASISCAPAGDCSATGEYSYTREPSGGLPFVVGESGGVWAKAQEVPGLGTPPAGEPAGGAVVSCSSPGECTATGDYTVSGALEPYVVSET
jgi:hypothetical protein